jgi:hypothetical protein
VDTLLTSGTTTRDGFNALDDPVVLGVRAAKAGSAKGVFDVGPAQAENSTSPNKRLPM